MRDGVNTKYMFKKMFQINMKIILITFLLFLSLTVKCDEESSSKVNVETISEKADLSMEIDSLERIGDNAELIEHTEDASRDSEETRVLRSPFNQALIDEAEVDSVSAILSKEESALEKNAPDARNGSDEQLEDKTEDVNDVSALAEAESKKSSEKEESNVDELVDESKSATDKVLEKAGDQKKISAESKFSAEEKASSKEENLKTRRFYSDMSSSEEKSDVSKIDETANRRKGPQNLNVIETKAKSGAPSSEEVKTIVKPPTNPYNLNEFDTKKAGKINNYYIDLAQNGNKLIRTPAQVPVQMAKPVVRKLSQEVTNKFNVPNYYPRPELRIEANPIQGRQSFPISSERRQSEETPQFKTQSWLGSTEVTNGLQNIRSKIKQLPRYAPEPKQLENLSNERSASAQNLNSYRSILYSHPDLSKLKPQPGLNPAAPNFKDVFNKLAQASNHPKKVAGNIQSSENFQTYPGKFKYNYYDPNLAGFYTFRVYR